MGANPVQIEVGEFDEAIDIGEEVEEVAAESKFTNTHTALIYITSQEAFP